jgi:hypothetical protein
MDARRLEGLNKVDDRRDGPEENQPANAVAI